MRLLIVGTLKGQLTTATKIAMDNGASVTHAEDHEQAMRVLRGGKGADLLLVDVALDIRDLVMRLEAEHIHVPIVACGISNDARAAVAAIHAGAKEYIPLPPDPELIAAVLAAVANDSRDLVYRDEAMAKVIKLAQQIAGSDASVMITGESGTGKEVLARYVHTRSHRARKPFISINCAAIPEHLLESELFGHEKGAFTGAIARRIGKFEEATGGTLLLDEISEMDVRLQSKLLRAIQERVIDRVGGTRPVPVDIRDLVMRLEAEHIHVPIVACGISNDARAAVAAIHAGAKEYIPLPPDPELIAAVLAAVANDSRDLIYRDEAMAKVIKLAQQIAGSDASVMITGESGTGKEVLARYVHTRSNRAKRPFISINCAAIPEHLLESELFGHEKGAFTGAVARRIGKFEEATGGTLLLDEISEMDVRLQSKLLRAIQERVIDRVGGTRPVPVDIRIIATSNRNLADDVREGTFREDLLFRLNVVNLKIPPLRERPADILELAQHFAKKYADANGVPLRPISADARRVLTGNRWQGNVRELENTIHRSVLMAQGDEIGADAILTPDGDRLDLAKTVPAVAHATFAAEQVTRALVGRTVADVERDLILETLKHCLGNRTHAANILGISIRTLRNKLNEYADGGLPITPAGAGDYHRVSATA